jgi:hypothetical protein
MGLTHSPELIELTTAADAEAIDRILAAVGKKHIPPSLDRKALCADIADANCTRDHAFDLFRGSEAQARLKLLRRIRKTAEKLVSLLKADSQVDAMITGQLEKITPAWGKITPAPMGPTAGKPIDRLDEFLRAVADIERVTEGVAMKWRTAHKSDRALRGRRPNEKEMLAGVSLPLVFEWNFRQRAGRSRAKSSKPSGPTVRFIGATMKELGLPYSDESIVRAYSLRAPLRAQQRKGKSLPLILRQI